MNKKMVAENHIVVFNDHKIRRVFVDDAWWFSVVDVIQTLQETTGIK